MGDRYEEQPLLGHGYRLDLVSVRGMVVLRRGDGSEVARFSIRDATSKTVEQAAREDYRARKREPAGR